MPIWLADISNWQEGINVEQIVAEGYSAVICKASEGTDFLDGCFDGWIPRIRNAGAIPGAYHFLRAGDGAVQARILFDRVRAHGGPSGFLIACDNEADASWNTTCAFVDEWRRISGDHPLLMYTGGWWWNPRGWNGASLTPHLWHSSYVDGSGYGSALFEQVPDAWWSPGYGGWGNATILQFSSRGRVAGASIDVNAFRGSLDELHALARGSGGSPPPATTTPPPVTTTTDGDWNLGMSFDDFKDGTVGAPAPDWMGGPRDRMRMGDWYGAVPSKLSEIHGAANAAVGTANDARTLAAGARDEAAAAKAAATEARDLARQALDAIRAVTIGGIDPAALAAALAPHLPTPASPADIAKAVNDDQGARLANG